MDVLKGVLVEGKKHYSDLKERIAKELMSLPSGSVKERRISGAVYYYLQKRVGDKIVHKYLGKEKPVDLLKQISQRRALKVELKKVNEGLRIVRRAEGRKSA
ncbi:MAG: hypothetical protein HQL12_01365 [Candidatus Omnitrophica bacterium]|nr:hypothetical protein [Candidatus Omnitrophota bacterium]